MCTPTSRVVYQLSISHAARTRAVSNAPVANNRDELYVWRLVCAYQNKPYSDGRVTTQFAASAEIFSQDIVLYIGDTEELTQDASRILANEIPVRCRV